MSRAQQKPKTKTHSKVVKKKKRAKNEWPYLLTLKANKKKVGWLDPPDPWTPKTNLVCSIWESTDVNTSLCERHKLKSLKKYHIFCHTRQLYCTRSPPTPSHPKARERKTYRSLSSFARGFAGGDDALCSHSSSLALAILEKEKEKKILVSKKKRKKIHLSAYKLLFLI